MGTENLHLLGREMVAKHQIRKALIRDRRGDVSQNIPPAYHLKDPGAPKASAASYRKIVTPPAKLPRLAS